MEEMSASIKSSEKKTPGTHFFITEREQIKMKCIKAVFYCLRPISDENTKCFQIQDK